jgi:hypothetical protein
MNVNSEALSTSEHMSSSDLQVASWEAHDRQAAPPDPATLSDKTLHTFLHYERPDLLLPSTARKAIEAESMRRGASSTFADDVTALAMLAGLPVSGVVIGLALLVP